MYTKQEVDSCIETFVASHIHDTKTSVLRNHVLHENTLLSKTENAIFPAIEESFQQTFKAETAKIHQSYVEKQQQLDNQQKKI